MSKFAKGSLITAGVMLAIGLVFCFVSAAISGTSMFYLIKNDAYLDGRLSSAENAFENFADSVMSTRKSSGWWTGNPKYLTVNDKRAEHNVWEEQVAVGDIRDLELELGAGTFYIREKETDDGYVDIRMEGVGGCTYRVKDHTLHVEGFEGIKAIGAYGGENQIILSVPAGAYFREVDIEIGAGQMELVSLQADKIDATVGAGELLMNGVQAGVLSAETGMGNLSASDMYVREASLMAGMGGCNYVGTIENKLEAECDMGSMEITLNGKKSDYSYEVECSAGEVNIDGSVVTNFLSERSIHNGGHKMCELECNMGNITLRFMEH